MINVNVAIYRPKSYLAYTWQTKGAIFYSRHKRIEAQSYRLPYYDCTMYNTIEVSFHNSRYIK